MDHTATCLQTNIALVDVSDVNYSDGVIYTLLNRGLERQSAGGCICPNEHVGHNLYWTQTNVRVSWFIEDGEVLFHKAPDVDDFNELTRQFVWCATCDKEVPELTVHDQVLAFK